MKLSIVTMNGYHKYPYGRCAAGVIERKIQTKPDIHDIQCLMRLFCQSESGRAVATISEIPVRCLRCREVKHTKERFDFFWNAKYKKVQNVIVRP